MSGFLDKKKRIIDYKITDSGLDKMSRGRFKPKYYTFSDESIFYDFDEKNTSDFKISNSLESFLPFELSRELEVDLNPGLRLDKIITFDDQEKTRMFSSLAQTTKTLSDKIIEKRFLDNLTSDFQRGSKSSINFDYVDESVEFDFINRQTIRSYPTIKYLTEDASNLPYMQNEKRFLHKIRNLNLPPSNSSIIGEEINETNNIPIEFVFKSLEDKSLVLSDLDSRENAIIKIINSLEKNDNLFKQEYVLNEDDKKDEDLYLFEMHKVIEVENSDDNLEKVAFIKLGDFIDKNSLKQKSIFLIGKIMLTRSIKDIVDPEDYTWDFKIDIDYSFVNMFTLVVE